MSVLDRLDCRRGWSTNFFKRFEDHGPRDAAWTYWPEPKTSRWRIQVPRVEVTVGADDEPAIVDRYGPKGGSA
jgi:hypothetical protein